MSDSNGVERQFARTLPAVMTKARLDLKQLAGGGRQLPGTSRLGPSVHEDRDINPGKEVGNVALRELLDTMQVVADEE